MVLSSYLNKKKKPPLYRDSHVGSHNYPCSTTIITRTGYQIRSKCNSERENDFFMEIYILKRYMLSYVRDELEYC